MKKWNLWVFVVGLIVGVFQSVALSMMAVGKTIVKESDGNSVVVDLLYTVEANQLAVVDSFVGITVQAGDPGDQVVLDLSPNEIQVEMPSSLNATKGSIIYVEVADVTGHTPDDTAYSLSAGSGKVAWLLVTTAQDDNDVVTGIVIKGQLAS